MSLKDILVHLDSTESAAGRLEAAAALARQHDAHLTALYVVEIRLPFGGGDEGSASVMPMLMAQLRDGAEAVARTNQAAFDAIVRRDGLRAEWRKVEGYTVDEVVRHGRHADLVVLGQADPDADGDLPRAVIEGAMFGCGRPVLIVPFAGTFSAVGRRVLIGWNGSRESARAVNDALPLLGGSEAVTVMCVNPDRADEAPGAAIATHLARHGIKVDVRVSTVTEISEGEALMNETADRSADLLVVGGYGHSRMREVMFGGVTRGLLRHMPVPVLMSH